MATKSPHAVMDYRVLMKELNSGVNEEHITFFPTLDNQSDVTERDPLELDFWAATCASPEFIKLSNNERPSTSENIFVEEIDTTTANHQIRPFLPESLTMNGGPVKITKLREKTRNKIDNQLIKIAPKLEPADSSALLPAPQMRLPFGLIQPKLEFAKNNVKFNTIDKKTIDFNLQKPMKLVTVQSENDCIVLENGVTQYLIVLPEKVKTFRISQ